MNDEMRKIADLADLLSAWKRAEDSTEEPEIEEEVTQEVCQYCLQPKKEVLLLNKKVPYCPCEDLSEDEKEAKKRGNQWSKSKIDWPYTF